MRVPRPLRLALALLLTAACDRPGSRALTAPDRTPAAAPTRDVSDGAFGGGNPHFFFLPPMVPAPAYAGVADGSLQPRVLVCEWRADTQRCGAVIADFTAQGGTGAASIRYDAAAQHYVVNWDTGICLAGPCLLDPARLYRLSVSVGGAPFGHADVRVVESGGQVRNAQTGATIALVNGRVLPVKFRIERGAVAVAAPGAPAQVGVAGGMVASADGAAALSIPAGALGAPTAISVAAPTSHPTGTTPGLAPVVDLGPDGTQFAAPVQLTLPFEPSKLPLGVPGSALAIYTADQAGGWREVPGSVADPVTATVTAPIAHFSVYTVMVRPTTIAGAPTPASVTVGQPTTVTARVVAYQTTGGVEVCQPVFAYPPTGDFGWRRPIVGSSCYTTPTQTQTYPAVNQAVFWSSAQPGVAAVASGPTYTNASGDAPSPTITGIAQGVATIVATAGGATSGHAVTVTAPPLGTLRLAGVPSIVRGDAAPAVIVVGPDGTDTGVTVPTTVSFTTSPNLQVLSSGMGGPVTSGVIPAGQGILIFVLHQLSPGPASLTVSAPGWGSVTTTFTFVRPETQTFRVDWPTSIVDEVTVAAFTADENGEVFGAMEVTTVSLATSPNLQALDGSGSAIATALLQRSNGYVPIRLRRTAPGPVSLTLSAPGWVSRTYTTVPTFEVEGLPPTQVGDRVYAIRQVDDAGVPYGRTTDTHIALATTPNLRIWNDPINQTPVSIATIPAGQGLVLVIGHQLAQGPASLTLSASGFATRTYQTVLTQPATKTFAIPNWPATLAGETTLDIRTVDAATGAGFGVSEFTTLTFVVSGNAEIVTGEQPPVLYFRPTQGQILPRLRRTGPGPITLTLSAPGWLPVTLTSGDGP